MAKETDEQIAVAACAKQLGFMVIDEYQTIHAILQSNSMTIEELYLREDGLWGHMTPKGNRLIAEIVGDVLTKGRDIDVSFLTLLWSTGICGLAPSS